MAIQVQIDLNTNLVVGISETTHPIEGPEYIPVEVYDVTMMNRKWNGTTFEERSNWDLLENE